MGFAQKLAHLNSLDGWTHNPYASPDSADAVATRIANRYIREITHRLLDMGYMPITGVEVNFAAAGISPREFVEYAQDNTQAFCNVRIKRQIAELMQPMETAFLTELESIAKDIGASQEGREEDHCRQRADLQEWLEKTFIPLFRKGGIEGAFRDGDYVYKSVAVALCEAQDPDDRAIQRLDSVMDRMHKAWLEFQEEKKKHQKRFHPSGASGASARLGGRLYVDANEVEVATEIGSPMATIARVDAIKKLAFEMGDDYHRLKASSSDADAPPVSSPIAQRINEDFGHFDVFFRAQSKNMGEHLNFSLWRSERKDYLALGDMMERKIGGQNMIEEWQWQGLFKEALVNFLPADTLLALGNDELLYKNGEHFIQTTKGPRLEIRSFHDSTSNLSLTMLSVLSIVYATVKTMQEMPEFQEEKKQWKLRGPTHEETVAIINRMKETYGWQKDIPKTKQGAKHALDASSVTLQVMREMEESYVPREGHVGETPLREEDVPEFRRAVDRRLKCLEKVQR